MTNPSNRGVRRKGGIAGGFFFAFSLVAGVVLGTAFGQPSIGMVIGLGVGVLLLLLVWLFDRRG